ncbi:hypothetical protein KKH23_04205 [Patescibacteria group bacterium]|nr:hypothetical protein [Patescibacteria group bacterium]
MCEAKDNRCEEMARLWKEMELASEREVAFKRAVETLYEAWDDLIAVSGDTHGSASHEAEVSGGLGSGYL